MPLGPPRPVTVDPRRPLGAKLTPHCVVAAVEPGGQAAALGLRPGMVVVRCAGAAVASIDQLRGALGRARGAGEDAAELLCEEASFEAKGFETIEE